MDCPQDTWRCGNDGSGGSKHRYAEAVLTELGGIDIDGTLEFFRQHGGYCDCEILFNVDRLIWMIRLETPALHPLPPELARCIVSHAPNQTTRSHARRKSYARNADLQFQTVEDCAPAGDACCRIYLPGSRLHRGADRSWLLSRPSQATAAESLEPGV